MSKSTPTPTPTPDTVKDSILYEGGYFIQSHQLSHLEGQLLTTIEALGLHESQEKAAKDLIRERIWGSLITPCFWIDGKDYTELKLKYDSSGRAGSGYVPS